MAVIPRDGTLVGYIFSKRYKKVSPHRKSHNLLYNLLREKNKPPQEMVNKRGVPIGPTWLIRTLGVRSSAGVTLALCFQTANITPILIIKLPMFTEHLGEHPLTSDSV